MDLQTQKRYLEQLIEHPGWKLYASMLEEQKNLRFGEYAYKPLASADQMPAEQFNKGECSGLALALVTPHAAIETLNQQIKVQTVKQEMNDAAEKKRADGARASRVDGQWHSDDKR